MFAAGPKTKIVARPDFSSLRYRFVFGKLKLLLARFVAMARSCHSTSGLTCFNPFFLNMIKIFL